MTICYREYKSDSGISIAAADKELIDKKFDFNGTEFHVNPRFYCDKEGDKEIVADLIRNSVNVNLVGKEAVAAGKESGMVEEENIVMISEEVPHAQVIIMPKTA